VSQFYQGIKVDVEDHNRSINNTMDLVSELRESGEDVITEEKLNKIQAIFT